MPNHVKAAHRNSLIGIPLGDIAGVGPEIVVMALAQPAIYETARPLVIGEISALRRALRITGLNNMEIQVVADPAEGRYQPGCIDLVDLSNIDARWAPFGQAQAEAGRAAHEFIVKAVELCQAGQIDALATTPINKEAFKAAGIRDIGHTELLGRLTGTADPLTLFQVFNLKVFSSVDTFPWPARSDWSPASGFWTICSAAPGR